MSRARHIGMLPAVLALCATGALRVADEQESQRVAEPEPTIEPETVALPMTRQQRRHAERQARKAERSH